MLQPNHHRRRALLAPAAVVSALALGALILHTFPPDQHTFYPRCPFYALTGLLCPGCGATRALAALTHGHLAAAFHANALIIALLPILLLWGADACRRAAGGSPPLRVPKPAIFATVTASLIFGIARNLA